MKHVFDYFYLLDDAISVMKISVIWFHLENKRSLKINCTTFGVQNESIPNDSDKNST